MTEKEYKNYIYGKAKTAHPKVIKHWKKIVNGKSSIWIQSERMNYI